MTWELQGPWYRDILEKLIVTQLSKKLPESEVLLEWLEDPVAGSSSDP
jgi:hypothetical protein